MVALLFWEQAEGFESHVFHQKYNEKGAGYIEEVYEWIPGYEGEYKVSNTGNVMSYKYGSPRMMHPAPNNCGYMQVPLHKNGRVKRVYVHRLVAMLFVDGYDPDKEVNHKDYNKANNTYTNLEWVTKSENHKHIVEHKPERCTFYKGDAKFIKRCVVCGRQIDRKATRCKDCSGDYKRRNWPSAEQLEADLMTMNFCEMGRKYGCTDNNVRRMCKVYGLPTSTSEVKTFRNGPLAQLVEPAAHNCAVAGS